MARRLLTVLSICSVIPFLWGCPGAYSPYSPVWEKGTLSEQLPLSTAEVHRAAITALVENDLTVVADNNTSGTISIKSTTTEDIPVLIVIQAVEETEHEKISPDLHAVPEGGSGSQTTISVTFGNKGDRDGSRRILEAIHSYIQ